MSLVNLGKSINICRHLPACHGCHYGELDYQSQLNNKIRHLGDLLGAHSITPVEITTKTIGPHFLRKRFDFTIQDGKMGLYGADRNLIDLEECFQLAPELEKIFKEFKGIQFPINKGSVRLRVGPNGDQGVWLDFANTDIKDLLVNRTTIDQLWNLGFKIEMGQKGKQPVQVTPDTQYKLGEPVPHIWFKTLGYDLKCLISSFTQPSWETADVLTTVIHQWIPEQQGVTGINIAEFGSGIGQFTLPLLAKGHYVDAFEADQLSADLLRLNAQENNLNSKLQIFCDDFHRKPIPQNKIYDVAVVNPPRSGLLNFGDELIHVKTKSIVYISCFPESLANDLEKLTAAGYAIKAMTVVDQFPQTKHYETCTLLQRVNF